MTQDCWWPSHIHIMHARDQMSCNKDWDEWDGIQQVASGTSHPWGYADDLWCIHNLFTHPLWTGDGCHLDVNLIHGVSPDDPCEVWTISNQVLNCPWAVHEWPHPQIQPIYSFPQHSTIDKAASDHMNQSISRQHLPISLPCPEQEARNLLIWQQLNQLPWTVLIWQGWWVGVHACIPNEFHPWNVDQLREVVGVAVRQTKHFLHWQTEMDSEALVLHKVDYYKCTKSQTKDMPDLPDM